MPNTIFVPPNVTQEPGNQPAFQEPGVGPAQNVWPPQAAPPPPAGIFGEAFISPLSLSQATWFVDPVNGKDTNDGSTPATAIQSFAELSRRWGKGNVLTPAGGTTTVTLLNSAPPSDPLNFNVGLNGTTLAFVGTVLSETPLAVTAVRAKNRAANTPWALTLTSTAASFIFARILDQTQSAPGNPGYFFGVKDEGADVLRVSEPILADYTPFVPVNTDTFVVQTLTEFTPGAMTVNGSGATVFPFPHGGNLTFTDLQVASQFALLSDVGIQLQLVGCVVTAPGEMRLGSSFLNVITNSVLGGPFHLAWAVGSFTLFEAGAIVGLPAGPPTFIVDISCTLRFSFDVLLQGLLGGAAVLSGTRWLFDTIGIFDSLPGGPGGQNPTGAGIYISPGATGAVTFQDEDPTGPAIWGSGNAGAGITVGSNATFSYDPTFNPAPMSITGAGGDFTLAGNAASWAPPVNAPAGPSPDTWANLFAGGAGPFPAGVAFDTTYNAWIAPFH
ncbi:MAG TPA: hypothetical protein VMI75_02825 [Polyangiaceae bacterium]|nr:hypothetical protein [Polyangiaceae bacterium]